MFNLTNWLLGGKGFGTVRLFEQSRHHEEPITPHSHRFDFMCCVLEGTVTQVIWYRYECRAAHGDLYSSSQLTHYGEFGKYEIKKDVERNKWLRDPRVYKKGDWYTMDHSQVHSIFFSKGAKVLFLEGPNKVDHSIVLEPVVNGKIIPTFKVEDWMFEEH